MLKRFLPLVLLVACTGVRDALREDEQQDIAAAVGATSTKAGARGALSVDRVYSRDDYGYAIVSYRNTSDQTFRERVTVRCDALDGARQKLGTNTRSFFADDHGPIKPGFEGTLEIPVRLNGATLDRVECWTEAAN